MAIGLNQFAQVVTSASVVLNYLRTLKHLLVLILIFDSAQELVLAVAIVCLAQLFLMSTASMPDRT